MADGIDEDRDLSRLAVPSVGSVESTGVLWEPVRLVDAEGRPVAAVTAFLKELQASGRSAATLRSYAMDLLRWFRFVWAVGVAWDQATRVEARDFCRWLALRDKPTRAGRAGAVGRGTPNPVTGRSGPGTKYAATTRAHSETVLRVFYDFHRDAGTGPMVNPFPLSRDRRGGRAQAR
jgi:site-specific recombinase XerD